VVESRALIFHPLSIPRYGHHSSRRRVFRIDWGFTNDIPPYPIDISPFNINISPSTFDIAPSTIDISPSAIDFSVYISASIVSLLLLHPQVWSTFVDSFVNTCQANGPALSPSRGQAPTRVAPTYLPPVKRLIAIGDLHGDIEKTRAVFDLAGLTDKRGRWNGGDTTVVQVIISPL
jgi:hypothetical protein